MTQVAQLNTDGLQHRLQHGLQHGLQHRTVQHTAHTDSDAQPMCTHLSLIIAQPMPRTCPLCRCRVDPVWHLHGAASEQVTGAAAEQCPQDRLHAQPRQQATVLRPRHRGSGRGNGRRAHIHACVRLTRYQPLWTSTQQAHGIMGINMWINMWINMLVVVVNKHVPAALTVRGGMLLRSENESTDALCRLRTDGVAGGVHVAPDSRLALRWAWPCSPAGSSWQPTAASCTSSSACRPASSRDAAPAVGAARASSCSNRRVSASSRPGSGAIGVSRAGASSCGNA